MSRHASLKVLAFYMEGTLRPRRASRIASHLGECSRCTGSVQDLQQLPLRLSNVAFPPIPEDLSYRIEMAIVAASTTRVPAAEPSSAKASRRDPPARAAGQHRRQWRIPVFSSPLAGSLAAVSAAVVIAGGGYLVATHLGTDEPSSTASTAREPQSGAAAGGAAASGTARSGPEVQFQHNGKKSVISSFQTTTNFLPATLRVQALSALQAARLGALKSMPGSIGSPAAAPAATGIDQRRLSGCVSDIAAGRNVLLVDVALYSSKPATIIVVGGGHNGPRVVYAVGPACSATNADVLAQQNLPQTAP